MTTCPLCGKPLAQYHDLLTCENDRCCMSQVEMVSENWWRRLARQVARLRKDSRKPSECKHYVCWVLSVDGKCCPCPKWARKRGGE